MKITQNPINNYITPKYVPEEKIPQHVQPNFGESYLPTVNVIGQSMVNANLPISYTKIGELSIPGLKDKASIFQLANGQKIIIAPKKGPTFVKTTYNVGSLNETEDIRGISHFIEHNLFNGSKELAPREYDKQVSDLGAYTNASTSFSVTDYFLSLQLLNNDSLEKAIRLNALQTQFPTFPADQLEKEKEPVKSEIDMYKDMPDDVASEIVLKNLFNIDTKSTNFILGTKENINALNRKTVLDYYNTWYTPDNAITVITGDVDTNETINLVSKYFNKKNDYSKINQRHYEQIQYNTAPVRKDIIQPNATTASVTMGFAVPEGTTQTEKDKLNILMGLLTSTGSDLSKALDKSGLSLDTYSEKMQNKPDGAMAIILHVNAPEKQIEDVIKTIYDELAKIASIPPSKKDVDAVRKQAINSVKSISETSQNLNDTLTDMALTNNYNYFDNAINNYNSITPIDISETARKYLDLNKVSMCVSHEKNSTPDSVNQNYNNVLNQSRIISFGASKNPKESINQITTGIKQYNLANNIETAIIPGNGSAKSSLLLQLNSEELNGIASPVFMILNEILNRGSAFRNKDIYQDILNTNDMDLSFYADRTGLNISANFSHENINEIMPLILETFYNPNFSVEEFNRAKDIIRDDILSENVSAFDKLGEELYPDIRTYKDKETRLKELDSITLSDIKNAYSLIKSTSKAKATLTAAVDENPYLTNIFNNEISKMPIFKPFNTIHSDKYNIYKSNNTPKILTASDEKAQAEVIQAYKYKYSENADDIAKIELLNIILGGTMSSRLFSDLREDKKLAYHVSSSVSNEMDTGVIFLKIGTTTDSTNPKEGSPDNLTKALEGFERNINLLRTKYVTEKELENAKNHLKSSLLARLESNSDLTASYSIMKNSPYGVNFYARLLESIDKINAEDIKNTANYVFANQPITSIVASKKTLEALNLK